MVQSLRIVARQSCLLGLLMGFFALQAAYATGHQASTQPHETTHQAGHQQGDGHANSLDGHGDHGAAHEYNVKESLFHHILDSRSWHLFDWPLGNGQYKPVALDLPFVFYDAQDGFQAFTVDPHHLHHHGHEPVDIHPNYLLDGKHLKAKSGAFILDFSPTKTVVQMAIVALLLVLVMLGVARGYTKRGIGAPKGLGAWLEPLVIFIRDEVAKPNLHGKHQRFLPYLLTLFFFILFCNLFGLTPLSANITGNISVTAALAVLTLILTNISGSRYYWSHILWPPVPHGVKLILIPVELVGIFTKPFALMIRLFANIAGGHFMILALVSLIFIMGELGQSTTGVVGGTFLGVAFNLVIFALELLVAFIQAYIFTLLTAVFVGQAVEEHHAH